MQQTERGSTHDRTVDLIFEIAERTQVSYGDIAAAAGVSPSTVRAVFLRKALPGRSNARVRLRLWAEANASAVKREDLRFV